MSDSSFDRDSACLLSTRRCLGGTPPRKSIRGYIRIFFALLLTVAAVLWIVNQLVTRQGIEDPYNANLHNTSPKTLELTKPDDKPAHQTSLQKRKGLQQQLSDYKIAAAGYAVEEREGQESVKDDVYNSNPDVSSDPAIFMYSEDGRLNQSPDNNQVRSMSDLVRSIEDLEVAETSQMEQAIRDLWIVAADLGAPDEALDTLEYFIMEHYDKNLIELADSAIEDLLRMLEMEQGAQVHTYTSEDNVYEGQTEDPCQISSAELSDGHEGSENGEVSSILLAKMEDLSEQALIDPDALKRGDAIQGLSNFRNDEAVDTLIEAADDPDPLNRYLALKALWISAADGPPEKEMFIWQRMQEAEGDTDVQIADLASRALKDLEQLEINFPEAEAVTSIEQEHYSEDVLPASQTNELDARSDPSMNY